MRSWFLKDRGRMLTPTQVYHQSISTHHSINLMIKHQSSSLQLSKHLTNHRVFRVRSELTGGMKCIGCKSKIKMTHSLKIEEMKIVSEGRKKIRRLSMLRCYRSKWLLSQSKNKMKFTKHSSKKLENRCKDSQIIHSLTIKICSHPCHLQGYKILT